MCKMYIYINVYINLILFLFLSFHYGRNCIRELTDKKYLYVIKSKMHNMVFHLCTRFKLKFSLRFCNIFTFFILNISFDAKQSTCYKHQYAPNYS